MFTGIITNLGHVRAITSNGITQLSLFTHYDVSAIPAGASIACNGICLSVTEKGSDWVGFDVSRETLDRTTLGSWFAGQPVNLERPLRVGDELGGHIVSGHVDGVGHVLSVTRDGASLRIEIEAPAGLARFIAPKGSVAVDGVSLTVNAVSGRVFGVNIIPITQTATNLGQVTPGLPVNLEIDPIARYVARLREGEAL